ncbi:MAG TPA: AAA family ATPase [Anaerolineae bacterium]|nr:AAA family ATPase [Anaerolineae bacterium]
MRIDTIAIDGFGQLHNARLAPAPGLTVVRGPNEAGKTTLLAFIRAMLFGFEPNRYPAVNGGARGGWLDVVMADGRELRIERYGDRGGEGRLRVIEADRDLGPTHLALLLQGVESTVYQNIFAFGLEELTRFQTLKDDEVAARIYGAGLGTGGVSGLKVESDLRGRMEGCFKSGGSKPEINELLKALEDIDRDLAGRDLPRAYAEAGAQLDEVLARLTELGRQHETLEAERRRQQRLIDGWDTWLELRRLQDARDALAQVRTFAAVTLERLSALEAGLGESAKAADTAVRERDRAQARLDEAVIDEAALAHRDELAALGEATRIEAARADERARCERELTEARSAMVAALAGLGAHWTIERVEGFDDSIAVKAEISGRFRTSLAAAEQALASARSSHEAAQEQLKDAEAQVEAAAARVAELDEALAGRPAPALRERAMREIETLGERLTTQQRMAADRPADDPAETRVALDERRAQARELSAALGSRDAADQMLPSAMALAESATGQTQRWLLAPLALGIGAVAMAVILLLLEVTLPVVLVVAAAGLVGAAMLAYLLRSRGATDALATYERLEQQRSLANDTIERLGATLGLGSTPSRTDVEQLQDALEEERGRLQRDLDRLDAALAAEREAERLAGELAAATTAAGLPVAPDADELEAFRAAIAADRETDSRRTQATEHETQARTAAEAQGRRVTELAAELERRTTAAEAARTEWAEWLAAHDLDPGFDRETAGRVVDSVTSAKGGVAAQRAAERRTDELRAEHAAYVAQVEALRPLLADGAAEHAGTADAADVGTEATLLAKRLQDALAGERDRAELAHALEERQAAVTAAQESRDLAQAELDAFLAESAVGDAATLRAEVERSRRAAVLDTGIEAARATLTTLSGPGMALQELMTDLGAVEDIADVKATVAGIAEQLAQLAQDRDELNQEAGRLRASRSEMETDADPTELRQERADLLSRLEATAERWAVYALAHHVLKRSRRVYEEAHRPAVVEKAEHVLRQWTDGRYERIVAPLGEDIRGIQRRDGVEISLPALSRGTSEQLYLALRFGLVQHFVETSGEPLPIVMDDILVNFDEERAARASRSIEELAQTCQVIYFTCHPSTPLEADVQHPLPRIEVA